MPLFSFVLTHQEITKGTRWNPASHVDFSRGKLSADNAFEGFSVASKQEARKDKFVVPKNFIRGRLTTGFCAGYTDGISGSRVSD
jgi:hypothetical protein